MRQTLMIHKHQEKLWKIIRPRFEPSAKKIIVNKKKKMADLRTGGLIPPAKQTGITAKERVAKYMYRFPTIRTLQWAFIDLHVTCTSIFREFSFPFRPSPTSFRAMRV